MKKVFIVGINGKMGKMLCELAHSAGYDVVGGFDAVTGGAYPVFTDAKAVNVDYDVIIDFSRPVPETLGAVSYLAKKANSPAVIATTGYDAQGLKKIAELSECVPVFLSANFSLGIAATKAAAVVIKNILGDAFDIEIVEKHHNQKVDNPSGTALLLADALADRDHQIVNRVGKRKSGELGIVSVRGGGVVGEHEVGFYGDSETVTLTHSASSRKLFALGAFKAADFLLTAKPGLYNMDDLTEQLLK